MKESNLSRSVCFVLLCLVGLTWGCGPKSPIPKPRDEPNDAGESDKPDPTSEKKKRAESAPGKAPSQAKAGERREGPLSLEQLAAALEKSNPGFQGNMQIEPISPELLSVAIAEPNLKDLRPLARQRIGMLDLKSCDVTDISPLEGMPLTDLYLEDNHHIADIGPLRGMPLQKLYLTRTAVTNLGPLRGMRLAELNLVGARVKDLTPLAETTIGSLWLNDCPVEDIAPLAKVPLVSLTLENTPVSDIGPLAKSPLERLHIGGTQVTDLTPLKDMRLTRLIFTPARIKTGLEFARKMTTLQEIGTNLEARMAPAEFWREFDAGHIK